MKEVVLELVNKERISRETVGFDYDQESRQRVRRHGIERAELVQLTFSSSKQEMVPSIYFNMTTTVEDGGHYPIGSKWKLVREEGL